MAKIPKKQPAKRGKHEYMLWPIGTVFRSDYLGGKFKIIQYSWNRKGKFFGLTGPRGSVRWCYRIRQFGTKKEIVITDHLADKIIREQILESTKHN